MENHETYTIKQIADIARVSTRTLRYYDQIGLLNPAGRAPNGYRLYDRDDLLRLQQILFFRKLEFPLEQIEFILERPDFHQVDALQKHRDFLKKEASRLEKLINTVDQTIDSLKGEKTMHAKDLFEGFDEEEFKKEARKRWGNTSQYEQSMKKWNGYSKKERERIKEEGGEILRRLVGTEQSRPDDEDVQQAAADYLAYINRSFYSCDAAFLDNLADGWVSDPRFAVQFNAIREGGAVFAREAVKVFAAK